MEENFKSGFVSIIGKTNVGKSTIINALVKEKVAAVANKTQTTRTAIKAIVNRPNSQIIFIDTPGIHKPKSKLGQTMIDTAFTFIKDVDVIVFVIDATSNEISAENRKILEKIKESKRKTILAINKIDIVQNKERLLELINLYKNEYDFIAIVPICATKKDNLEVLLDEIEKNLKPGPAYYDIDEYTDQTTRQLVEEIIREKALRLLRDEVPHGIYVQTEKVKYRKTKSDEEICDIDATIYALRESHKGIIIGKDGNMLKKIATFAREDLEDILGTKVNLKVWVKVKEDWLNNETIVNKFKLK